MRYVQLRAFHYVAISGGFSRAAAELFLTQPAISDQVRKLESEYDILLFNRERKQVTLTPAGENLLQITRRMFDAENQALELLSESRALRAGVLRIVADAAHHILHILHAFREKYPGVMVTIRSGNTETVVENLLNYEADIGVLGDLNPSREFDIIRLDATPITAFTARDNPLARSDALSFAELATLPLVGREVGSKTRRRLEESAARDGVQLNFMIEAEGREAVREIVASGLGVGFVSEAEFGLDPRLVKIPIRGEPVLMEEALICLSERSQAKTIRAFLDLARTLASREAPQPSHRRAGA
ncbi:LysR substrate-binding domain-containing protein [Ancylobacter sp. MQZ15Z-1]|uniref:LysR substrate-binding domain-containing protein n=1 Tax=Ancylobacter mangrovi TaxID=2972472 RepID=A0A9X2P8Z7_9HYPH|nr:LysR substrate-binding domain-containing protein [Ancylobacter mangrovi]MCS0494427.1 LysR substrate-binding domain-containing protein [Ancylobacter mangrovi]